MDKMYAKDCIRKVMCAPDHKGQRLAVHEIQTLIKDKLNVYHSENSIATRLSELARYGEVRGALRPGLPYKEWEYLGDHTAMDPAAPAPSLTECYFFYVRAGEVPHVSPFYTSWQRAMSAAAKHLNDERKTISVYTGEPTAPRTVVTLSK